MDFLLACEGVGNGKTGLSCILFIMLTTCFGHCGPSSGHKNVYRGKLYYTLLYSFPLYIYICLWPNDGPQWPKHVVIWNVTAAQKQDFVFRRNGRVHLNKQWASVRSTTGSRDVRISGSNAGYTMFWSSVKGTGYPLHSPVSPSLPLPNCL